MQYAGAGGATLHCDVRDSHCGGFSCFRARALGAWAQALGARASAVVVHGFRCSPACGTFLDQGSNPCPLHLQVDSQLLSHQGSP